MNLAHEMFSALTRPLNRFSSNEGRHDNSNSSESRQTRDSEEDGFLLVGQSRSERTTVRACDFSANINSPPDYQSVTQNSDKPMEHPPTYTDYCRSLSSSSNASMELSVGVNMYQSAMSVGSSSVGPQYDSHQTAVSDVPFVLAPEIQVMVDVLQGHAPSRPQRQTSVLQYNYDFSLENSVLSAAERAY